MITVNHQPLFTTIVLTHWDHGTCHMVTTSIRISLVLGLLTISYLSPLIMSDIHHKNSNHYGISNIIISDIHHGITYYW